ncbi:hypothetical protein FRC02_004017, partial [Tulasnella sp. 418]
MSFESENTATQLATNERLLGNSNYYEWSLRMQDILQLQGVWRIVSGEDKASLYSGDAVATERFHQRSEKALASIYKNMSVSLSTRYKNELDANNKQKYTSPKELWKALETEFKEERAISAFFLFKKIFTFKIDESDSIENQINDFLHDLSRGERVQKFDDKAIILMLLSAMPESYNNFIESILATADLKTIKLDDIIKRLKEGEALRQRESGISSAYVTAKMKVHCTGCNKMHAGGRDTCWVLHPNLRPKQKKGRFKGKPKGGKGFKPKNPNNANNKGKGKKSNNKPKGQKSAFVTTNESDGHIAD